MSIIVDVEWEDLESSLDTDALLVVKAGKDVEVAVNVIPPTWGLEFPVHHLSV